MGTPDSGRSLTGYLSGISARVSAMGLGWIFTAGLGAVSLRASAVCLGGISPGGLQRLRIGGGLRLAVKFNRELRTLAQTVLPTRGCEVL
jgi:hypothetical protein